MTVDDVVEGRSRHDGPSVTRSQARVVNAMNRRGLDPGGGVNMPKPKKAGGRVVKMSLLIIARTKAELLTLVAELEARHPDMTPAALQALKKRLRRAMGLIR